MNRLSSLSLVATTALLGAATTLPSFAAEIVVIMGPQAAPLSTEQIANIYLGRSFDLRAFDQPEGSPLRDEFYKRSTSRDSKQIAAVWSRVVFTGKGRSPAVAADAAAVKKAVAADPKAIGYIEKSQVDGSVTVVHSLPD